MGRVRVEQGPMGTLKRVLRALSSRRGRSRAGAQTLAVGLASLMAVGVVTLTPSNAYAAPVPDVRTPLPQGKMAYGTRAAFGSAVVWDTKTSSDGGSTWTTDPALETPSSWDFIGGGKLVSLVRPDLTSVVVYAPSTGPVTYPIASGSLAVNPNYATYATTATNLVTGTSASLPQPSGVASSYYTQELSAGNAILWHGLNTDGAFDLFAAAPDLVTSPGAWVQIPSYEDYTITDTDLFYVVSNASGVSLCRRPVTSMATESCTTVVSGDFTVGHAFTVTSLGALVLVQIMGPGDETHLSDAAYVVTADLSSVAKVSLPAGSWVESAIPGGAPYLLVRDQSTVPSVQIVAQNGSLSAGFDIPTTQAVRNYYLGVAPNRVDGGDPRDGSAAVPVWTRTVSASGFGAESPLPRRASGVIATAGRTAIVGRDGLSMYDRGVLGYTFADADALDVAKVSGPYVAEQVLGYSPTPRTLVSKVDGTAVNQFDGWPVALFGSLYIESSDDTDQAGSKHVLVRDLTGALADASYSLPAGTAGCVTTGAWGSRIVMYCGNAPWADTSRVYDFRTGALIGSTPGMVEFLGDGYAVVALNDTYEVWNLAANTLDVVTGCHSYSSIAATDGVGHVVCQSDTDLVWRDYSSLSTSAGQVLGWLAPSTFASGTWSPQIDATKAFSAGVLRISQGATTIKDIPVAASADGSVRGVSWDGKNSAGSVVSSRAYTATLLVSGADGSGPLTAIDGTSAPTFSVSWTGGPASPPGSFSALSPSRLLDTRDGTGVASAGAVAPNGVVDLQVTGRGGVPASGVGAVILNVTAVTPRAAGFLTVYPTGGSVPNASNLNFTAGQAVPNLVVAKVGAGGKVSIRNSSPGASHVVADVAGYFFGGTVLDPGGLTAVTPSRLLDTRDSQAVAPNGSVTVQASGRGGVPASGVAAVVLNLTAVTPAASGFLTAYPTGGSLPNASNVNFTAGQVVPNLAFVKLAADGSFTVRNGSPGATQVVADVAGYVLDGQVTAPGMFVPLAPTRVLDTRPSSGGAGALAPNTSRLLQIAGSAGVPAAAGVSGVVMNVTAVASGPGFLTVFPAGGSVPNASNLNFTAGQVVPNLVAVKTSASGGVTIQNSSPGSTNVIADVAGYFTG